MELRKLFSEISIFSCTILKHATALQTVASQSEIPGKHNDLKLCYFGVFVKFSITTSLNSLPAHCRGCWTRFPLKVPSKPMQSVIPN